MENQNFFSYSEVLPIEKFKGVIQLLKESWIFYRSKIKTILGIMVIPVGLVFLSELLINFLSGTNIKYSIWFSIIWAFTSLISFFFWFWAIPSLIFCIKEGVGVKEAYKKGLKMLIPYIWVYFLFNTIILGGFILFIIPGILFSIWFSLAIFVLVFEEKRGMNALFKSQHLISGKFWGILWRFLGFGLIILFILVLIVAPIIFLFKINRTGSEQLGNILGYLLQLFVIPFALIYGALIYQNLEKIKKEVLYKEANWKRKLKYLLPGLLGLTVWVIIIGFSFINIFLGRDEPPIDDSDLWLSRIEIPKEENAFYYLIPYLSQSEKEIILEHWPEMKEKLKEKKEIYMPVEKKDTINNMIEGKEWDEKFVEDLLEKNKEVLNDFEKVVELPYYQDPMVQDPKKVSAMTPIFSLGNFRTIGRLNLIRSIYLFKQGKEEEAFDEIIKTIQLGQMLEDSPRPTLIGYLVGMAIKGMGLKTIRTIVPVTTLSSEKLMDYISKLDKFDLNEAGLERAFKMEYAFGANTKAKIDAGLAGKLSKEELEELDLEEISLQRKIMPNYLYKPNQTQRLIVEYYRTLLNNTNKNYNQTKFVEFEPFFPSSRFEVFFTENAIGKTISDATLLTLSGIFRRKCEEDFLTRGTQILLALKAYKNETGKLPLSLSELIPKYFDQIPQDPFDGKPIRYLPEKRIIYSVSSDLKDAAGGEGDVVFKIEF